MSSERCLNNSSSNVSQNSVNKSNDTRTESINEPLNGVKSDSNISSAKATSKPTQESHDSRHNPSQSKAQKTGTNRSSNDSKPQSVKNSSRLPIYTANGVINRQRRNSDGPQSQQYMTNNCRIHGNHSPSYGVLSDQNTSAYALPDKIRAIHNSHRCSNTGKSRSVPSSNLVSNRTSPASTPSTPTDSRRIAPNRNAFTPTSTPSRSASKSSLSMLSQTTRSSSQKICYEYWPLCEVQKGLEKGDIVEGVLRINPRNYSDAYISAPEGGVDIYVGGMIDRNRAFHGDRVAVKIHETNNWKILRDAIRIHWHIWGEQFEHLSSSINPNQTQHKSVLNAQNNQNNVQTIYETDENPQSSHRVCDKDDISRNDASENQSSSQVENGKNDVNHKIDKSEALDASKSATALPLNSDQNDLKQKKKRSRPRKKKNGDKKSSEDTKQNDSQPAECDSSIKPEVFKSTQKNKQNRNSNISNKTDELSEKISKIESMKIDDLMKLPFWQKFLQKTGRVVAILEENHSRQAGGRLQQMKDKSIHWALFVPNDSRVPRMRIPMKECPPGFLHHPQHFAQSLFIAKLDEWKSLNSLPNGTLVKHLGDAGDVEAESQLLLIENNIEFDEFPDDAFIGLSGISDDSQWTIPEEEIRSRRDFRKECVFTIDPSTARDLDDALSIKQLDDDLFEVGVHIADVSYFLREDMPLDQIARRRTTSVYLVQKVIPMLPRILCEKLCSLNAGEDKLTFSVIWTINKDGHVLEECFTRTIINSCVKLSYELAQDMIDDPNKDWKEDELPQIYGNWSAKEISKSVNMLNELAVKIRKSRFEKGALKIDKLKLHFILDFETGLPSGFSPYIYRDSNRLIEEFMLLANMAVAHKIYKSFDDKAFLRCHPPPGENPLNDFKSFCKYNNFQIDTSSSLALQQSLDVIVGTNPNISKVVAHFLLKAMQMATYLCTGVQTASTFFHHYALNVPLYTHFTSPIRRYADVIVHRLLAASLSYRDVINDSAKDLHRLAQKCNEKKMNSRLVSEASSRLFLNIYIKQIVKMEEKAIVVQVHDHSFDVMLLNCGLICRVYLDRLPLKEFTFETKQGKNQMVLKWDNDTRGTIEVDSQKLTQTIIACLIVNVQVSMNEEDSTKLNALLQHPSGIFYTSKLSSLKTLVKN